MDTFVYILSDKAPVSASRIPEASTTSAAQAGDIRKSVQQTYVTPLEVLQHLRKVWESDEVLLDCLLGSYPSPSTTKRKSSPELFFLKVLPVPPSRFRPVSWYSKALRDIFSVVALNAHCLSRIIEYSGLEIYVGIYAAH